MHSSFEERAFSEDVQIACVNVIGVAEFLACCARAHPMSLNSLQSAFVEAVQAPRPGAGLTMLSKPPNRASSD